MSTRALRRHHRSRMIARAYHKFAASHGDCPKAICERLSLRYHDHLASCSCPMCGNPRRWFGEPTRQERLAALDAMTEAVA